MKNKINYKHIILFVLCIFMSIVSFVLYFSKSDVVSEFMIILDIIDFILLCFNSYYLSRLISEEKIKIVINTLLFVLGYLLLFMFIGSYLFREKMNLEILYTMFQIALFIGPILILVLPIMYLVCLCIGG